MKSESIAARRMTAELLAAFFVSPEEFVRRFREWQPRSRTYDRELQQLARLTDSGEARFAYGRLFWGTDYRVKVPLWTSACRGGVPMLCNEVTLSVIRFYHSQGWEPEILDGNPPDFIGTQLKFVSYLLAHGRDALGEFLQLSLIDTVLGLTEAVEQATDRPEFLAVCRLLREYTAGGCRLDLEFSGEPPVCAPEGAPIPDGPEHLVRTGGYNNCGGKCVIHGHVQEGCVLNITTDNSENAPQIRACVRGRGYRYTYFNPDRLRYPMKRVGKRGEGKFQRISWEEAVDLMACQWRRIRGQYGPESTFVMYSWGISAMIRPDNMIRRLLNLDGGFLDAYNTYSDACTVYVSPYIYGDSSCGNGAEDLLNTKFLILWGNNPAETVFGSEKNYYLAKVREQGIPAVVIDPRCSETALAFADRWIGIRPSTDSALADGMAYVILTEGLEDRAFLNRYCLGFDEDHMPPGAEPGQSCESYLLGRRDGIPKTPAWASQITGVPEDDIVWLARTYAAAKPACILPGLGLQRTGNGEQTTRSLAMLAAMTGNVGIPGGGSGASPWEENAATPFFPTLDNPYPGQIPNFLWTKAVDKGCEVSAADGLTGVDRLNTGIKMIFLLAGNTLINQHSNVNDSARILSDEGKCEFIVCSDVFLTPSARYADLVLPAASGFENSNICGSWLNGDYFIAHHPLREPLFGCRFEYGWVRELAEKLGYLEAFDQGHGSTGAWMRELYGEMQKKYPQLPEYEAFREAGVFKWKKPRPFVAYEDQIRDPEHHPFATPSGKIELYSQTLRDMGSPIPPIPCYVPCPEGPEDPLREKFPLQLIGWHTKRRTHSIHDNNRMMDEIAPQQLWIHRSDAEKRNIREGDPVLVYNDRGAVRIAAHVTDRIVAGVCAMAQGGWYTPDKDGVDTRGCINVLTSTAHPTPLAHGNPQHTNLVEVRKEDGR